MMERACQAASEFAAKPLKVHEHKIACAGAGACGVQW